MNIQYDFFEENDEISLMRKEIACIDERARNVQRGLFARLNAMGKEYMKLQDELDRLREMMMERKK